jgi:hypothetical protein
MQALIGKVKDVLIDKETIQCSEALTEYENELSCDKSQSRNSSNPMLSLKRKQIIGSIIQKDYFVNNELNAVKLGKDVFTDIELFETYNSSDNSVVNAINNTYTDGGSALLHLFLSNPIHDKNVLQSRVVGLTKIYEIYKQNKDVTINQLQILQKCESAVMWIYGFNDAEVSEMYELVYFRNFLTRVLNKNDMVLTGYNLYKIVASPLIGVLSPIIYYIIPYLIIVFKFNLDISLSDYIKSTFFMMKTSANVLGSGLVSKIKYVSYIFSLVFYFQGIFNTIEVSKLSHRICKQIYKQISEFVEFLNVSKSLLKIYWSEDVVIPLSRKLFTEQKSSEYLESLNLSSLGDFSLIKNFGRGLTFFKLLDREALIPSINKIYLIDHLIGLVTKLHKEMNLPIIHDIATHPHISLTSVRHPCLPVHSAVENDIFLGNSQPQCMLLTGPNAGGKSTLLKAILVNLVLCQSIGIGTFKDFVFTPFAFINSQINIPDCKGKESLFEAEMYRCKYNLDQLQLLTSDEFAFIGMDEIFNSTNPVEGIAGAHAIAKHLGSCSNTALILTTHYLYLTNLAKDMPNNFINYKMNVIKTTKDDEIIIKFPYQLCKGISRQYIALDLLRLNGFNNDILASAELIKQKLTAVPRRKVITEVKMSKEVEETSC